MFCPKFLIILLPLLLSVSFALQPPRPSLAPANWGSCEAHPGKDAGIVPSNVRPVLVRRWDYKQRDSTYVFMPSVYLPRMQDPYYYPSKEPQSTKYKGFDFYQTLWPEGAANIETDTISITLHRAARIYLVMPAFSVPKGAYLPGFKVEGLARINKPKSEVFCGLYKDRSVPLRTSVVLFSRLVGTRFQLPSPAWIRRQLKGIFVPDTRYQVLLSEADGSASVQPIFNYPLTIQPGQRCPSILHDTWFTTNDDPNDADISRLRFPTWHPLWDPCYWCTYGHEHGSNSPAITGIKPMFSYPALKNGGEYEQHEGHKIFVFEFGRYYFAYVIHCDLSTQHRFFARVHSGGIIITDKNTRELLVYTIQKVDFGTLKVRIGGYTNLDGVDVNSKVVYIWPLVAATVDKSKQGVSERSILINIINGNVRSQLDPRYTYRLRNLFVVSSSKSVLHPNYVFAKSKCE
jgi:hypothetical protein